MSKGKVIGVLNQKGGVGKSNLTQLLSTALYIGENKKRDNDFVCVYDADIPQYTIHNIRKNETEFLKDSLAENENSYIAKKFSSIYYDGFKPFKIYKGNITEIHSQFEILREKHSYSFIDVVGTVNVEGYDQQFLTNFDFIIVPSSIDYEPLRSSLKFINNIIHPLYKNNLVNYALLFNMIDGREWESAKETLNDIKKAKIPVFETMIRLKRSYSRLHIENSKNNLSSYFYNYDRNITNVLESLINKIK